MNSQQILVEFYRALERHGCKNLVDKSRRAARAAGAEFSNAQASIWLAPFTAKRAADGKRTGLRTHPGREKRAQADESRTGARTQNGLTRDKESLLPGIAIPNGIASIEKPKAHRAKRIPDHSWVAPFVRSTRALANVTLADLNADERFIFARYFAFKLIGLCADEQANIKRAGLLLAQVHDLGRAKVIGGLTVAEYFAAMDELRKRTGARFIYRPFDVKGVLEYGDEVAA